MKAPNIDQDSFYQPTRPYLVHPYFKDHHLHFWEASCCPCSQITLKKTVSVSEVTCPSEAVREHLHSDPLVLSLPCLFPRTLSGIFLLQRPSSIHLTFIECLLCAGNCSKPVMSLPSCSETRLQKANCESLEVWEVHAVSPRAHPWRQSIFLTKLFAPLPPVTSLKESGLFFFSAFIEVWQSKLSGSTKVNVRDVFSGNLTGWSYFYLQEK